jgi:hypothetical protein
MHPESHEVHKWWRRWWVFPLVLMGLVLSGVAAGYLAGPGRQVEYLGLQEMSDSSHRLAIVVLPSCLLGLLLALIMSRLGWRLAARTMLSLALTVFASVLAFIIHFDGAIEKKGLRGQLITGQVQRGAPGDVLGPFVEEPQGPGVTTSDLADGDVLTLDRRTLARRNSAGTYLWNRPRPGRHPATLMVAGDTIFFAGPGPEFEDDILLTAVDLASGRLRWSFHCLGNQVRITLEADRLALVAARPSHSVVILLGWTEPRHSWSIPLPGRVDLAPRFTSRGIEVATGSQVLMFDPVDGSLTGQADACLLPERLGVVCESQKVVAWATGTQGD